MYTPGTVLNWWRTREKTAQQPWYPFANKQIAGLEERKLGRSTGVTRTIDDAGGFQGALASEMASWCRVLGTAHAVPPQPLIG